MMNYENPEYTGNIENFLLHIDSRGEQQVLAALQDIYDDRATESLAGVIGDSDTACEAIALSLIDAYQKYGDIGPIEDHFYCPNSTVVEAISYRTKDIKRDYLYAELDVLLDSTQHLLERKIELTDVPHNPPQSLYICSYYSSGVGGIAIDAEIYDDDGFSSMYEMRLSKHGLNDPRINPYALNMLVYADLDGDNEECEEKLLFDIPDYHKSIIVQALGDMVEEEIAFQFRDETDRLERIMYSTQDPVELRTKLEDINFIY